MENETLKLLKFYVPSVSVHTHTHTHTHTHIYIYIYIYKGGDLHTERENKRETDRKREGE